MQLSVITSLYNRLELTRTYLRSLEETLRDYRYEVILIDDGSTDGTREFLSELSDPRYRIILNETRRGFAPNNNAAARLAAAPLLCLLNNDTVLLPGWFQPMEKLVRWIPRVACVGNVQREPVSGLIDHYGIYIDETGQPLHAGHNQALAPPEYFSSWPAVTAACVVIPKKIFQELGGFNEGFQNGLEDVDFCLRASARGYHHVVANRSLIYHHISASPGRKENEARNFELFRQRWPRLPPSEKRETVIARRLEGWRYLRKHLHRPWRYNLARTRAALGKIAAPRPAGPAVPLLRRMRLRAQDRKPRSDRARPVEIFMFVHDTARNPGRSGIQTVVRGLAAAFGRAGAPVGLVIWDPRRKRVRLLPPELSAGVEAEKLRQNGSFSRQRWLPSGGWILMPEVMYKGRAAELVDFVKRRRCRLAAIFHDAIPVQHPEFAPANLPAEHAAYMRAFTRADLILPVSETSARAWKDFVAENKLKSPPLRTCTPASDISKTPRIRHAKIGAQKASVRILCVSTLEPRKNHQGLLEAYDLAIAARPQLNLELSLVGAPYVGARHVVELVHGAMKRHPGKVQWYEQLEYSLLRARFEECDFTVYPSLVEGFGLPVVESLWFARPCICANFGAMAENAAGGGCLTTDVSNPQKLAESIITLATNSNLRKKLTREAIARPLKSWDEYAGEILDLLAETK